MQLNNSIHAYEMSWDDGGLADADDVVAHGAGELGADAGLGPQVPDPQRPIVASADELLWVLDKLGREDFLVVSGESVTELQVVGWPNSTGEVAVRRGQQEGPSCIGWKRSWNQPRSSQ